MLGNQGHQDHQGHHRVEADHNEGLATRQDINLRLGKNIPATKGLTRIAEQAE
jgi:hypothetical protein